MQNMQNKKVENRVTPSQKDTTQDECKKIIFKIYIKHFI
jgi:hypothetical protein